MIPIMPKTSRRRFLSMSALAPLLAATRALNLRAQGLGGQFAMPSQPPCTDSRKATPEVKSPEDYKPAPKRSQIAEGMLNGPTIVFSGSVIGLTCGNVKNARIDLWQSDLSGHYDQGTNYRGYQTTDGDGKFSFLTIKPGVSPGRAPHFNVRIEPPGKPIFETQLFFPDDPRNSKDPAFKPELVVKVDPASKNSMRELMTFNFILNI